MFMLILYKILLHDDDDWIGGVKGDEERTDLMEIRYPEGPSVLDGIPHVLAPFHL